MDLDRVGIDFGGVIVERFDQCSSGPDTSFSSDHKTSKPVENAISSIAEIVKIFGADNVFIVSKCGTKMRQKTLEWLEYNKFYQNTGVKRENVHFCFRRPHKGFSK